MFFEKLHFLERIRKNILTELYLSGCRVNDETCVAIAEALETSNSLTYLNLRRNNFGKRGWMALSKALKTNSSLRVLHLGDNSLGDEGCIAIAEGLKFNNSLTFLDIGWNQIRKAGYITLAKALETNTSLTTLDIECNWVGNEGYEALVKTLKTNTALLDIRLWNTQINESHRKTIDRLTHRNWLRKEPMRNRTKFFAALFGPTITNKNHQESFGFYSPDFFYNDRFDINLIGVVVPTYLDEFFISTSNKY